jgi:hypothetical protein
MYPCMKPRRAPMAAGTSPHACTRVATVSSSTRVTVYLSHVDHHFITQFAVAFFVVYAWYEVWVLSTAGLYILFPTMLHLRTPSTQRPYGLTACRQNMRIMA